MRLTHPGQLIFVAGGIILISACFVYHAIQFMRAEHTIYCWDNLGLWLAGAEMLHGPDHSIIGVIATFGRSMHHNYNNLCGLPSSIAMAIWGTSRFCYVMANVTLLILPAIFVCLWLFFGLTISTWSQALSVILAYLSLLAAPLTWIITLRGLTDVGGLIMAAIATDLLSRTDLNSKSATRWFAIGAAMAMTALSRRWYLFLVVGMFVVLAVESAVVLIRAWLKTRSLTMASVLSIAYGPCLCFCGLIVVYQLSFPFIIEILKTNYASMDTAYKTGGTWFDEIEINGLMGIQHYGLIQFALSCACFIAALLFDQTRRAAMYLFFPGWLAVFDFSHVQTIGDHHLLLLFIPTVALPLFLARYIFSSKVENGKAWGWTILACSAVISCLNFQSVFALQPPLGTSVVESLFSNERVQPIQRHDLGEIEAMMQYVNEKVANSSDNPPIPSVYLIASSLLLNSSYVSTLSFQLNKPIPADKYFYQTSDVDLVEGFPDALLTAKLVLVADPVQTHLMSGQKVVTVPTQVFLRGDGFASAFQRDSRVFQLDDGIRVYAFERTRPSTPEEIEQFRQQVGVLSIKVPTK